MLDRSSGQSARLVAIAVLLGLAGFAGLAVPAGALGADLYVSPGASDASTCSAVSPCGTFNRAYAVALPGQVVEVAGGTYGGQRIDAPSKPVGPRVVFQPAPGAPVTVDSIDVYSDHLEFRDMRVTEDTSNKEGADDVTYLRMGMSTFLIRGASNISYVDSDVGPNDGNDYMNWITAPYQSSTPARNVLIQNTTIHDFVKHNDGAHVDCIGIDDVDGLVIRDSVIRNCEHFSLIFGKDVNSERAARNVLIENNFLDCCRSGYYSIGMGDVEGPMTIRHNSTNLGFGWLGGSVEGLTISSNVMPHVAGSTCDRATWRYNVIESGSRCGTGDRIAPSGFRNEGAVDFHLRPGAAAIDAGDPASGAARDIDGESRAGNRPDAGADEANASPEPDGGGPPPPPPSRPDATGADSRSDGGRTTVRRPTQWKREAGAPRATLRIRKVGLRRFRRRGLVLRVRCSERCAVRARMRVARRLRGRLRAGRSLDVATRRRRSAGTVRLRLKPSRREARRLRDRRRLRVQLAVTARDRQQNKTSTRLRLVIRR